MRKWFFYCSLFILIFSCSGPEQHKIIPRKDLVPLLVDMHISDAMATNYNINEQFGGLDSAILYRTVLNSYGYTKDEFIHTIEYYSKEPERLIKIYDEVFSILSKRSEEAKTLTDSYSKRNTQLIWKASQSHYRIYGDTAHYEPVFDFPIDTVGTFILSVEIKITEKDKSHNPRLVAYFYNAKNDIPAKRISFQETNLLKSSFKREYTLIKECNDFNYNRMHLVIPMCDNSNEIFFKDMDVSNLQVTHLNPHKEKIGKRKN
jgi:hypothetical protein